MWFWWFEQRAEKGWGDERWKDSLGDGGRLEWKER